MIEAARTLADADIVNQKCVARRDNSNQVPDNCLWQSILR